MNSTFYITNLNSTSENLGENLETPKQDFSFITATASAILKPTPQNSHTPVSKTMSYPFVTKKKCESPRELSSRYPTNCKVLQIVTSVHFTKKDYLFKISLEWSDNTVTSLNRNYAQLFKFQCKLLDMFPFEAGENKSIRIIPFLPGRQLFTQNSRKLAEERLPEIDTYINEIVHLPDKIRRDRIVVDFLTDPEETNGTKLESNNSNNNNNDKAMNRYKSTRSNSIFYPNSKQTDTRNRSHTTNCTNSRNGNDENIALIEL